MPYRVRVSFVRWLLRIFFHRVEVTGLENIPEDGGGLVVSWHPNAIIDGGLVLAHFPRQIVLGARHGLFAWPVLGRLMRALKIVPVYRRQDFASSDEEMRREANRKSLDVLAEAIAGGKFAAFSRKETAMTSLSRRSSKRAPRGSTTALAISHRRTPHHP